MNKQDIIQVSRNLMHNNYCNGITINYDNVIETGHEIRIYFDFLIPKKVIEGSIEHTFYYRLQNVGLMKLSKKGELLSKSSRDEFVKEVIAKYRELMKQRERFIIRLFADKLISIHQIHLSLTPLRKVLRRFIEQDFRVDNLNRNFEQKEINYINLLYSLHYIRKEGEKYTLDNEYIKKLDKKINEKEKENKIEQIISIIFAEHSDYIIYEMNNTAIIPYIGILVSICNLLLELSKNIKLSIHDLFKMYKDHYLCGQNEYGFEDKVIDMEKSKLLLYDNNKNVSLPIKLFQDLITNFKISYSQKQLT